MSVSHLLGTVRKLWISYDVMEMVGIGSAQQCGHPKNKVIPRIR
jgi:hypothetical protein